MNSTAASTSGLCSALDYGLAYKLYPSFDGCRSMRSSFLKGNSVKSVLEGAIEYILEHFGIHKTLEPHNPPAPAIHANTRVSNPSIGVVSLFHAKSFVCVLLIL